MADVRQRLATLLEQRGAPGAHYLVVRDGVPLLELSHGLADERYAAPVTPTATFNAYSITKPFTTAAVLALTEVGALDLDEPMGRAFGVASLADYGSVRETVLHRVGLPTHIRCSGCTAQTRIAISTRLPSYGHGWTRSPVHIGTTRQAATRTSATCCWAWPSNAPGGAGLLSRRCAHSCSIRSVPRPAITSASRSASRMNMPSATCGGTAGSIWRSACWMATQIDLT